MKKKAKTKEVRICGWTKPKPCTAKLDSGHQKWCPKHKLEIRRVQNQKAAQRYAKKWGNQRLTTKQTAMIKLEDEKPKRATAKQTFAQRSAGKKLAAAGTRKNEVLVGGTLVEVLT